MTAIRASVSEASAAGPETESEVDPIIALLLSGAAATAAEAEAIYLDTHLEEVIRLAESSLSDEAFRAHPLIALLFAHGSRPREDSLR
jgi:hypothetical protein